MLCRINQFANGLDVRLLRVRFCGTHHISSKHILVTAQGRGAIQCADKPVPHAVDRAELARLKPLVTLPCLDAVVGLLWCAYSGRFTVLDTAAQNAVVNTAQLAADQVCSWCVWPILQCVYLEKALFTVT